VVLQAKSTLGESAQAGWSVVVRAMLYGSALALIIAGSAGWMVTAMPVLLNIGLAAIGLLVIKATQLIGDSE